MRSLCGSCLFAIVMVVSVASFAASNPKQLSAKELEMAKQMNVAYAQHLYSSTCMDRQKSFFLPKGLTPDEQAKRNKGFQKSCDCLSGEVIKATSPNDVIDYITQTNGATLPNPSEDDKEIQVDETAEYTKIRKMSYDSDARRKCGFAQ